MNEKERKEALKNALLDFTAGNVTDAEHKLRDVIKQMVTNKIEQETGLELSSRNQQQKKEEA